MSLEDDLRLAWQGWNSSTPPDPALALSGADRLYRRLRWREWAEYAVIAAGIAVFGWFAWTATWPLQRLGAGLTIAGALVVAWGLHRRASPRKPRLDMPAAATLRHLRAELARQRDALGSVATWYLAPLAPGAALWFAAPVVEQGWGALAGRTGAALALTLLVAAALWWINRRGAQRLAREVAEIDAALSD